MGKTQIKSGEKKVTLKLLQRVVLNDALLQQGNKAEIMILNGISEKIKISQKEAKDYGVRFMGGGVGTNGIGAAKTFTYSFSEAEVSIIKKSFIELDKRAAYTKELLDVEKLFD